MVALMGIILTCGAILFPSATATLPAVSNRGEGGDAGRQLATAETAYFSYTGEIQTW